MFPRNLGAAGHACATGPVLDASHGLPLHTSFHRRFFCPPWALRQRDGWGGMPAIAWTMTRSSTLLASRWRVVGPDGVHMVSPRDGSPPCSGRLSIARSPGVPLPASWGLELEVLIGREGVQGDRVDGMVGDPRPDPMQGPKVHDRRKHHPLHRELLNALQQGLPRGPVAFPRLLLKERIDVRIAPIRVGPLRIDERLDAGRRVP